MSKKDVLKSFIETESEITGNVAAAVLGSLAADPSLGVVIGGASGPIITRVLKSLGSEIKDRKLGPREEIRMGAVYTFAIEKILKNEQYKSGLRQDGFFSSTIGKRPDAEEVFEGIVLSAQKEYEESKIQYCGNLLGNIACDDTISKEHAHQLIKLSESLSYNQLCLLKVVKEEGRHIGYQN